MELVLFLNRNVRLLRWLPALVFLFCAQVFAQHATSSNDHWPPENLPPLTELPQRLSNSIVLSTDNTEAQLYFNYGLSALHSFAYLEAYRSFEQVQKLAPNSPMGAWGKAYSMLGAGKTGGQLDTIITQVIAKREGSNALERSYITALIAYTQSDQAYIKAFESLIEEYPDELEAKLLLAFFMNDGYDHHGQPQKNQAYAKAILQPLLSQHPEHIGLHHYWIHATEASNFPRRAAASLAVLEKANSPFGHIIHMPGHMAWLEAYYPKAVKHFRLAEKADVKFLQDTQIDAADYWPYYHNMAYLLVAEIETGTADIFAEGASAEAEEALQRFTTNFASRQFSRVGDWKSFAKLFHSLPLLNPLQRAQYLHASIASVLNHKSTTLSEKQHDDVQKKLNELRQLVLNNSNHALSQTLLFEAEAITYALNGNGKAAVSSFKEAILWESKMPYEEPPLRMRTVYETAGQTFCFFGAFNAGVSMYEQAVQSRPVNGFAIQGLVSCLKSKGDPERAKEYQIMLDAFWPLQQ